jgi:uncharacterized protein (DUF1697 family)
MPEIICVFLRGVNVGGVKIKMDLLKKAFAALSFPDARTVLASGNVLIAHDGDRAALKAVIEQSLSRTFSYDANVFLRSIPELQAVSDAAAVLQVPDSHHLYYLICDSCETIGAIGALFAALPREDGEAYIPLETGAFWIVPKGRTLESNFGKKALGDKKFKDRLTSRNIGTIDKILDATRSG